MLFRSRFRWNPTTETQTQAVFEIQLLLTRELIPFTGDGRAMQRDTGIDLADLEIALALARMTPWNTAVLDNGNGKLWQIRNLLVPSSMLNTRAGTPGYVRSKANELLFGSPDAGQITATTVDFPTGQTSRDPFYVNATLQISAAPLILQNGGRLGSGVTAYPFDYRFRVTPRSRRVIYLFIVNTQTFSLTPDVRLGRSLKCP